MLTAANGRVPWIALVLAGSFGMYGYLKKDAGAAALTSLAIETAVLFPAALGYLLYLAPTLTGMLLIGVPAILLPIVWFGRRLRTVSRERLGCSVSRTISLASSSKVQRARPSGGLAHAVATSSASSLPVSLRAAPGRGSSWSARSKLPSTKRRLVR